jgi:hypothetical protein
LVQRLLCLRLSRPRLSLFFRDGANYIWDGGLGLSGGFIADNQWHHVAVTIDDSGAAFYVDGDRKGVLAWTGVLGAVPTTAPLQFGSMIRTRVCPAPSTK